MVELTENSQKKFKDVFKRQLKYHRIKILRCTQEELATKLNVSTQHYKSPLRAWNRKIALDTECNAVSNEMNVMKCLMTSHTGIETKARAD